MQDEMVNSKSVREVYGDHICGKLGSSNLPIVERFEQSDGVRDIARETSTRQVDPPGVYFECLMLGYELLSIRRW